MRLNKFPAVCFQCRKKIEIGKGVARKSGHRNFLWLHKEDCQFAYDRWKLTKDNPACPKCGAKDTSHLLPSYGENCWLQCGKCNHSFGCDCK